jgi:hypothetical protein
LQGVEVVIIVVADMLVVAYVDVNVEVMVEVGEFELVSVVG